MSIAQLLRLSRWMKRIGKQQQTITRKILRCHHRRCSTAHRTPADNQHSRIQLLSNFRDDSIETFLEARHRIGATRASLPVQEVEADHIDLPGLELIRECEHALVVQSSASAVRGHKHHAVIRSAGPIDDARGLIADRNLPGNFGHDFYLIIIRAARYASCMRMRATELSFIIAAVIALGCASTGAPITDVTGTWGGDDAGLIATDTSAHVHIGCTLGDTKGRIIPDADGHFSIAGTYDVDAYPVERGIIHPALFTGQIVGRSMTLTVTLTDTARTLGPVTLVFGKEPKMGACPICRHPGERVYQVGLPQGPRAGTRPISSRN